jgi:hypothetical protein
VDEALLLVVGPLAGAVMGFAAAEYWAMARAAGAAARGYRAAMERLD